MKKIYRKSFWMAAILLCVLVVLSGCAAHRKTYLPSEYEKFAFPAPAALIVKVEKIEAGYKGGQFPEGYIENKIQEVEDRIRKEIVEGLFPIYEEEHPVVTMEITINRLTFSREPAEDSPGFIRKLTNRTNYMLIGSASFITSLYAGKNKRLIYSHGGGCREAVLEPVFGYKKYLPGGKRDLFNVVVGEVMEISACNVRKNLGSINASLAKAIAAGLFDRDADEEAKSILPDISGEEDKYCLPAGELNKDEARPYTEGTLKVISLLGLDPERYGYEAEHFFGRTVVSCVPYFYPKKSLIISEDYKVDFDRPTRFPLEFYGECFVKLGNIPTELTESEANVIACNALEALGEEPGRFIFSVKVLYGKPVIICLSGNMPNETEIRIFPGDEGIAQVTRRIFLSENGRLPAVRNFEPDQAQASALLSAAVPVLEIAGIAADKAAMFSFTAGDRIMLAVMDDSFRPDGGMQEGGRSIIYPVEKHTAGYMRDYPYHREVDEVREMKNFTEALLEFSSGTLELLSVKFSKSLKK